ncbi:MAG TPA: glutathione S-transferase family protein [Candidatus Kapabacteria bacterium]|nr:glutathione S-transferase family protein [Candidatus Kapabacteria bacterium]
MRLYQYHPSGNCYKIRLLLNQLGIPYEKVEIDILRRESRTPEFLRINPNGRIPVLDVNGRYLPESNAALYYLAQGTRFFPQDRFAQAQVLQWMFFEQYSHEPYIATIRFWVAFQRSAQKNADEIRRRMPLGYAALEVMERHLSQNLYFVDNRYSIADITLFAYTHVAEEGGFQLSRYPHLQAWIRRVQQQPGHISIED